MKSSCALEGLLVITGAGCNLDAGLTLIYWGLPAGEDFAWVNLVGVGILVSLALVLCPGLTLGTVRFGDVPIVLDTPGVTALGLIVGGLAASAVPSWPPRIEYGPAVAGRGTISGLFPLDGLTGATDSPPPDPTPGFGRVAAAVGIVVVAVDEAEAVVELDAVRVGEK